MELSLFGPKRLSDLRERLNRAGSCGKPSFHAMDWLKPHSLFLEGGRVSRLSCALLRHELLNVIGLSRLHLMMQIAKRLQAADKRYWVKRLLLLIQLL